MTTAPAPGAVPLPGLTATWRRVPAPLRVLLYLAAAYLVGRGAVELGTVDYGHPAAYRLDWGGPSLLGVLAVHVGPGLAVAVCTVAYHWRRHALRGSAS